MMKRIVSAALALIMIFSMLTTVSARTLEEATDFVPNPMELELGVKVLARASETKGDYTDSLAVTTQPLTEYGVDYKATLDMGPIRDLLDEQFISVVLAKDAQAIAEYEAGIISTSIDVVIDYPAAAQLKANPGASTTGTLYAGSIFSEKSRSVNGNKLTITYVNKDNLTVKELTENREEYLKDIAFELNDTIAFDKVGTHKVSVVLLGSTQVSFATKTQTVSYVGSSSHILNYSEEFVEHVLTVVPQVPATCKEKGSTEGVICSTHNSYFDCGAIGTHEPTPLDIIPHTLVHIGVEPATCSATGMEEHYTCSFCKTDFTKETQVEIDHNLLVIAKKPHTIVTIPGVAPDCIKGGLTEGEKCSVCGIVTVAQKSIAAHGHDIKVLPAKAATCEETGITEGKKCSECGVVTVAQKTTPKLGHKYGDWKITKEPTETATGLRERECSNGCGTKETVEIPKLVHNHVVNDKMEVITKEPTCDKEGEKQQYCSCGEKIGKPIKIPAKGHIFTHVTAVEATCSTEGIVGHYFCSVCNTAYRDDQGKHKLNKTIAPKDKKNHGRNIVTISAVEATCISKGLTEGKKCKACNLVTEPQKVVPMAKHALVKVLEEPATCLANGIAEHMHCAHAYCNKDFAMDGKTEKTIEELTIPATGHNYGPTVVTKDPTEDNDGEGYQLCKNDQRHEKEVKIKKLEHQHNETLEEITKAETCTETGLKRRIYACCGEMIEDNIEIPMHPHTLELIPTKESTCFEEGIAAHYQCKECKKLFDVIDKSKEIEKPARIPKLDHAFNVITSENANVIVKKCANCNEVIRIDKEKAPEAEVKHHGSFKDEKDEVREKRLKETKVETNIKIEKIDDVSAALYEKIIEDNEKVAEEKVVLDIVVEKSITHKDEHTNEEETEIERIPQTTDLIMIEITIPEAMRQMVDFIVHRLHIDEEGVEHIEKLFNGEGNANKYGEYIEIDLDAYTVTVHARRFSEYALVGYETIVNPTPNSSSSALKTVTFNANGGTSVDAIRVKSGSRITAPETTREGYVLEGWYTDMGLTNKFNFDTAIYNSIILYAKWTAVADIPVAPEDFDKFVDLGGFEWAEAAINYLASKDIIKGVTDTTYEPGIGIKRGDIALLMVRQFGLTSDATAVFDDVPADMYYSEACRIGKAHGVLLGVNEDNTLYEPERIILREEMAALIVRSLVTMGHINNPEDTDVSKYTDAEKIEAYAVPYVAYLTKMGVVQGNPDGTFRPKDKITRAEAAQILYNLYKLDIDGLLD